MGYRVEKLLKGSTVHVFHSRASSVEVRQNHLFLFDSSGATLAIYQSGWWVEVTKVLEEKDDGSGQSK